MSYQRDIRHQFMLLQHSWASEPNIPEDQAGIDPVIGQKGDRGLNTLGQQLWPAQWGAQRGLSFDFSGLVTLKGESREMLGVRRPVASPAPQDPCPDTTA
jgi:hypothetical protein